MIFDLFYLFALLYSANPNLPDHNGVCPLHVACHELDKPSNIIFDLANHGANTNQLDCYG